MISLKIYSDSFLSQVAAQGLAGCAIGQDLDLGGMSSKDLQKKVDKCAEKIKEIRVRGRSLIRQQKMCLNQQHQLSSEREQLKLDAINAIKEQRSLNKLAIHINKIVDHLDLLLEISEQSKLPLDKITLEQVVEYKAKKADHIFAELISISNISLKKAPSNTELGAKKKKKKKVQKKVSSASNLSQEMGFLSKAPVLESKSHSKISSPKELRGTYVCSIYKRKNIYKIASRVLRWEISNLEIIRGFLDRGAVQRYAFLSDEEIRTQRLYHLLTGLELILSEERDRNIYSFPTNTGRGLIACLISKGKKNHGCIYLGIDKDNRVYHKYFVESLFQDQNQILYDNQLLDSPLEDLEKEKGWESTTAYEFEVSKDGIISIKYPKEECVVEIIPIRKKLLPSFLKD